MFTQIDPAQLQSLKDIADSNGFKISTEFTALHTTLINRLKQQLISGALIGMGYAQPRQPDAPPQFLVRDTWSGYIKPSKDEVSHAGLQYLGVRIIPHHKAILTLHAPTDTPCVVIKPLGRPSLRPYILEAFTALQAAGKIDFNISLKAHVSILSEWVDAHHPSAMKEKTEIDYTTVNRVIGKEFQRMKLKTKISKSIENR